MSKSMPDIKNKTQAARFFGLFFQVFSLEILANMALRAVALTSLLFNLPLLFLATMIWLFFVMRSYQQSTNKNIAVTTEALVMQLFLLVIGIAAGMRIAAGFIHGAKALGLSATGSILFLVAALIFFAVNIARFFIHWHQLKNTATNDILKDAHIRQMKISGLTAIAWLSTSAAVAIAIFAPIPIVLTFLSLVSFLSIVVRFIVEIKAERTALFEEAVQNRGHAYPTGHVLGNGRTVAKDYYDDEDCDDNIRLISETTINTKLQNLPEDANQKKRELLTNALQRLQNPTTTKPLPIEKYASFFRDRSPDAELVEAVEKKVANRMYSARR